jgi:hypothetical protein
MTAVADWHGRVTHPDLNLRGDITRACDRLHDVLDAFDYKKAAKPPYVVPSWAEPMLREDGLEAVKSYLETVHPRDGRRSRVKQPFKKYIAVYRSLDIEGLLIQFCNHYFAACEDRTPPYGTDYRGYLEEVALLEEMSFSHNDHIKFKAVGAFGKSAPPDRISFLSERAEQRSKDCRNPNILLCRSLEAVRDIASRFPGVKDRLSAKDRAAILKTLPWLVRVLDREGRNNYACNCASESLKKIIETTGAPGALEAYLHNFKAPKCDSQWMIDFTDRYHEKALPWLKGCTGQDFGTDFEAWKKWFDENESKLHYHAEEKKFILDARAARDYRSRVR